MRYNITQTHDTPILFAILAYLCHAQYLVRFISSEAWFVFCGSIIFCHVGVLTYVESHYLGRIFGYTLTNALMVAVT